MTEAQKEILVKKALKEIRDEKKVMDNRINKGHITNQTYIQFVKKNISIETDLLKMVGIKSK